MISLLKRVFSSTELPIMNEPDEQSKSFIPLELATSLSPTIAFGSGAIETLKLPTTAKANQRQPRFPSNRTAFV
jgi:hypothetical protein